MSPATSPSASSLHLVGSIPLADSETVFRTVAEGLGGLVHTIPDGETGPRSRWNAWTRPTYERTPGLELVDPPEGSYTPWKQARLVVDPEELVLERIGYADAAIASWGEFRRLKQAGVIPEPVRFQVCIPSPVAPMIVLVEERSRLGVEPAVLRQLHIEIDEILVAIPHDELAIQWDVCQDIGIWEGYYPAYFDDREQGVIDRLAACADKIPSDVEVGFHLCYGDFQHQHFMQPRDLGVVTAVANRLTAAAARPLDWVHVPVPIDRDDETYFAPLADLHLDPRTRFYLGLIHYDDGVEGAARRAQAARGARHEFGIGTECGFGRRAPETVPRLLALHAEIAERLY